MSRLHFHASLPHLLVIMNPRNIFSSKKLHSHICNKLFNNFQLVDADEKRRSRVPSSCKGLNDYMTPPIQLEHIRTAANEFDWLIEKVSTKIYLPSPSEAASTPRTRFTPHVLQIAVADQPIGTLGALVLCFLFRLSGPSALPWPICPVRLFHCNTDNSCTVFLGHGQTQIRINLTVESLKYFMMFSFVTLLYSSTSSISVIVAFCASLLLPPLDTSLVTTPR